MNKQDKQTTTVDIDVHFRGYIWLIRAKDIDKLHGNAIDKTKYLRSTQNKALELSRHSHDVIEDQLELAHGYLSYGLPCSTWTFKQAWKVLGTKGAAPPRLARWKLGFGSSLNNFEWCVPDEIQVKELDQDDDDLQQQQQQPEQSLTWKEVFYCCCPFFD
jgi:hypothetical protein